MMTYRASMFIMSRQKRMWCTFDTRKYIWEKINPCHCLHGIVFCAHCLCLKREDILTFITILHVYRLWFKVWYLLILLYCIAKWNKLRYIYNYANNMHDRLLTSKPFKDKTDIFIVNSNKRQQISNHPWSTDTMFIEGYGLSWRWFCVSPVTFSINKAEIC